MRLSFQILAFVFLTGCVRIPETGQREFIMTSPQQENQLGTQGYKEVLSKSKIDRDAHPNEILQRVGRRLASASKRNDFQWEFNLIESKEINAWCMPGGKVAVYTGILPVMENESGMATVLGHEIAHATLRHAGQRISQQMIVGLGLSVAQLGMEMKNTQHRNLLLGLLGAGAQVGLLLPFGRDQESEADRIGLRYMAEAGYDPSQSIPFWKRMEKASGGGAPPEFLSTHPGTSTRIRNLREEIPEVQPLFQRAPEKTAEGEKIL
jgi:metalloendopeptidase OMA1, mitochondrial